MIDLGATYQVALTPLETPVEDDRIQEDLEAIGASLPSVVRFRFSFVAKEPIALPAYAGSAWRGILGHGLRRVACVTRQPTCEGCMLRFNCLYSMFFETPSSPDSAQRRYQALPHPFVLEPEIRSEREILPGTSLGLGITLMGDAAVQVPYLIHALNIAGERGLGRGGGRFSLVSVEREDALGSACWEQIYDVGVGEYLQWQHRSIRLPAHPPEVRVVLVTPLRVKRRGKFVGAAEFEQSDLLRNLCMRVAMLAGLYGGDPMPFNWRSIGNYVQQVSIAEKRLRWHDWTRYSSRQNTRMQMGGLLGEFILEGDALPIYWPALWLGQWVHAGKGTSFGLGGYRLL